MRSAVRSDRRTDANSALSRTRRARRTARVRAFRFDRDFTRLGLGRFQRSSGTDDPAEFAWRNALLTRLVERGDVDILEALHAGTVSIAEVVFADRRGRLEHVLSEAARRRRGVRIQSAAADESAPALVRVGQDRPGAATPSVGQSLTVIPPIAAPVTTPEVVSGTDGLATLLHLAATLVQGANDATQRATVVQTVTTVLGAMTPSVRTSTRDDAVGRTFPGYVATEVPEPDRAPLWDSLVTRTIPLLECVNDTKRRYQTSLESLRRKLLAYRRDTSLAVLAAQDPPGAARDYPGLAVAAFRALAGDTAVVSDLGRIDKRFWRSLQEAWGNSPADWNHMRRALSATLTSFLQSVDHPLRRAVIQAIPLASEGSGRVPDLTPEVFWQIVEALPEIVRPAPVVLVATGMRLKEYLSTTVGDLRPNIRAIRVPGTKTEESRNLVYVSEELWPWIEAGVPAPLCRKQIWTWWDRARKQVGVPDVRLHDLRHCLGQWATDAGVQEKSVQWALRHRDPNMTRRYTQSRGKREVAEAMGKVLARDPSHDLDER